MAVIAAWGDLPVAILHPPTLPSNPDQPSKTDLGRANKYLVALHGLRQYGGHQPAVTDAQFGAAQRYVVVVANTMTQSLNNHGAPAWFIPAVTEALIPLETKVARVINRAALQGMATCSLLPLPDPAAHGTVPLGFPNTRHDFDCLAQPPASQIQLNVIYRLLHFYSCIDNETPGVPFPAVAPHMADGVALQNEVRRAHDYLRNLIA